MTHAQEKAFRQAASRHGRRKTGRSLCEGRRCCAELLTRRPDDVEFVLLSAPCGDLELRRRCESLPCPVETVRDATLAEFATTESPQGIVVLFKTPPPNDLSAPPPDPLLLVLDGLADPGNLGTLLRTAWAVGLQQVCLTTGTTDPYAPKTIRAGMGAQFALTLSLAPELGHVRDRLIEWGWGDLWLAVPAGGVDAFSEAFTLQDAALVIGGEAHGVSDTTVGRPVSLPMPGTAESLNAAQAATVLLFDAVRRGVL